MNDMLKLLVFNLNDAKYALHLTAVKRVIRAVEITPLPKAPDIVEGIINMEGAIIPVFNIRKRFLLKERSIDPGDQFIIADTSTRQVALFVDSVGELVESSEKEITDPKDILPDMPYVKGVVKLSDDLILIHDLDTFLSLEEEKTLTDALEAQGENNAG